MGYDVTLIVADGKNDEIVDDIKIYDIGKPISRLERMRFSAKKVYQKALEINAEIYHFHDPELIPYAAKLIKKGKFVIYDVHEDLPRQFLSKPYLNKIIRKFLSIIIEKYENFYAKKMTAIVAATDLIKQRFEKLNNNVIDVKNYPLLGIIPEFDWQKKQKIAVYIGLLSKIRGIKEIVEMAENSEFDIFIAGKFSDTAFEKEIKNLPGWKKVKFLGFLGRNEIIELLQKASVGFVTLYPTINYKDALPVKMFEYMLAGVPVIASDIDLWRKIIENESCGLVTNPYDVDEIYSKVKKIMNNDDIAQKFAKNGREAILKKYNWNNESKKLIELYKKI